LINEDYPHSSIREKFMCGIVGYIGEKKAYPILVKGLQRLEYRGYDSAGVALVNHDLTIYKKKGKVAEIANVDELADNVAHLGIGHTRWATHGIPNEINAHPHVSGSRKIALVHNGIIENYAEIKKELLEKGHTFLGQTDTEVLVHLIEDIKESEGVDLSTAVRLALNEVRGTYAIVVVSKDDPDTMVAAKKGSPLAIGVANGEFFVSSDATPIVEYTKEIVYLEDEQIAVLAKGQDLKIVSLDDIEQEIIAQTVDISEEALEKGGYDHFMLKEIFEQPKAIANSMRGRIIDAKITLTELDALKEKLVNAKRIVFVACGTSWHAGLVAEHLFEDMVKIPAEVEYASEFRYRNPIITKDDIIVPISQSGETADTLAAIDLAKKAGATVLSICNVVGSSIPRNSDATLYTYAGPEISVASTKAFTTQLTTLTLLAMYIAQEKGSLSQKELHGYISELEDISEKVEEILGQNDHIKELAQKYAYTKDAIYLGRNYNFPVALEGALKLKEISYVHAEGYAAAEMKHGPIALIDDQMPVFVITPQGPLYEKTVSNIQETKARSGRIIAIVTKGDTIAINMAEDAIEIPESSEFLSPLLTVIPMQLLSYHMAIAKGTNVDQPRNLAKSVTVE
jgi:glucosamine--fructose-6-phosphate aminotransferase (isomerizing)